ncbi:MAG TPA: hypothetical protein DHV85_07375 [Candidatus Accumulibacter sp.]|nr:hypothetical protein [Accumulibacter sp.]
MAFAFMDIRHKEKSLAGVVIQRLVVLSLRWKSAGIRMNWYCRELFRADVRGTSISELSVYCTGDWDAEREAEHRQAVKLIRP